MRDVVKDVRDLPGGLVVKTLCSKAGGPVSITSHGTRPHMLQLKILHAPMKMEDPECHN